LSVLHHSTIFFFVSSLFPNSFADKANSPTKVEFGSARGFLHMACSIDRKKIWHHSLGRDENAETICLHGQVEFDHAKAFHFQANSPDELARFPPQT
jgi:hypothetical protein